jgi:hypothetical protein
MISIGVGFLWQVIEAAHNWTYVTELSRRSGAFEALTRAAHPSALTMIALGVIWTVAARKLTNQRASEASDPPLARSVVFREIEAALKTSDDVLPRFHEDERGVELTLVKRSASERDEAVHGNSS